MVKIYFQGPEKTDQEGIKKWGEKEYQSRIEAAVNLYIVTPQLNMKKCAEACGLECQRLSPVIRQLAQQNELVAKIYQQKTVEKSQINKFKPDQKTIERLLKGC